MSLDTIINLQVTIENRAPSQAGFGTPLILAHHTAWPVALVREYSDAEEMLDDGFTTDDQAYKDAIIAKSQPLSPATFKVGRRATPLTQKVEITPTVTTAGFVYTGSIDGQVFSVTVQSGDVVADICDDLVSAIGGLSAGMTPTDVTSKVTLTATAAGEVHALKFGSGLSVLDVTVDTTTDDELAAIASEDSDWYGLIVADSQSKATALLQAALVEANKKISIIQTADTDVLNPGSTTDTMAAIKAASYANTGVVYHRDIGGTERLNTGWLAGQLVPEPGSSTFAFKEVRGVSVDKLTTTQQNAILAKNGSYYVREGGLTITYEGKSGSAQFLDTTRGLHWLYARIQERLIYLFASNLIVPFTDGGVDLVRAQILAVLKVAVANKFLSPDVEPTVTAPLVKNVSPIDRINRRLPDITFDAQLGGAIHGVRIRGRISV